MQLSFNIENFLYFLFYKKYFTYIFCLEYLFNIYVSITETYHKRPSVLINISNFPEKC